MPSTGKGAGLGGGGARSRKVRTGCAGGRDWSAAGRRGSGAWGRASAAGLLREGRHDEHRAVARELALRLLAERDGGAHLRLLHHHRLQRPERPGAAARLADHAVSAAGRGCRGWAGVCAPARPGPVPAGSTTAGDTGSGGLGTPQPCAVSSRVAWVGAALPSCSSRPSPTLANERATHQHTHTRASAWRVPACQHAWGRRCHPLPARGSGGSVGGSGVTGPTQFVPFDSAFRAPFSFWTHRLP